MSVQASGDQRLSHKRLFGATLLDASGDDGAAMSQKGDQPQFLEVKPESRAGWRVYGIRWGYAFRSLNSASDATENATGYAEISERDDPGFEKEDIAGSGVGGLGGEQVFRNEEDGVLDAATAIQTTANDGTGEATAGMPAVEVGSHWEPEEGVYRLENPAELNMNVVISARGTGSTFTFMFSAYMVISYAEYTL